MTRMNLRRNFVHHLFLILVLSVLVASAAERWEVLPPTPAPIKSERSGQAEANGISIYYAVYGQGPPVILLHGGLANADYWGNQIKALAPYHTVIVMDSRGHGSFNGSKTRDCSRLILRLFRVHAHPWVRPLRHLFAVGCAAAGHPCFCQK